MIASSKTEWDIFYAMYGIGQGQKTFNTLASPVMHGKYTAFTDTNVQSNNYKKFFYASPTTTSIGGHIGYIREDTVAKKVYYLDKFASSEDLLYDFSLSVGDSIYMNFMSSFAPFPSGYYKVKSIQNITIKAGIRKQFNLKRNTGFSDTLKIVESLGSLIHPIYIYKNYFANGAFSPFGSCYSFQYDLGLACKWDNNIKRFQSCAYSLALTNSCFFKLDSCNYWNNCGGINELTSIKKVSFAPNPSSNYCSITIESSINTATKVNLIDVTGRIVNSIFSGKLNSGENEIRIETSELESGLYFVNLYGNDFNISQPLIISH